MALSIDRLKYDKILIKNLEAVQTCSMLHDICIGKTGTITDGNLSVKKFHLFDSHKVESNTEESFFKNKVYL
jgi:P-type E1-E2 ATPase